MKKLFLILPLLFTFSFTQAQLLEKLKKKAEKKAEDQINKVTDKDKLKNNQTNDTQNSSDTSKQTPIDSEKNQQLVINSKYDFIPGEKVIFFDDFTAENIGDFPVQWNTTGSGEIVTNNVSDGRWFHLTNSRGITALDAPLTLPDNYTIEFDVIPVKNPKNNNSKDFTFYILSTSKPKDLNYGLARPGEAGIRFDFQYANHYFSYYKDNTMTLSGSENEPKLQADKKYRISICVQKERIKLYIDQEKLFDLPKAMSKNYKYNMIRFEGGTPMIGDIRIATGLPDMRKKLLTEGKLVCYGIYFDVNKDVVKPESYPSLKEIAAMLKENPDVKIKIVGHTDSDGDDKSNLDLSKRRAVSVKNVLVNDFNLNASLIETDGKGESESVAPNDSITNKGLNRRVEFIKL